MQFYKLVIEHWRFIIALPDLISSGISLLVMDGIYDTCAGSGTISRASTSAASGNIAPKKSPTLTASTFSAKVSKYMGQK